VVTQKKKLWVTFILALVLTACGYRFVGGGSFPSEIGSVFVEIFTNRSSEVGVENIFTNDLIYEITRKRDVYLDTKENAEGILSGAIAAITVDPASRSGETTAVERRVTARLNLKLTRADGNVVWAANGVSANQTYVVEISNQDTEDNKREAISTLSRRLAEIVYNQLTSDF
jgi:outer membrane lipopolysaccharide assembly protein LptE/RlpB